MKLILVGLATSALADLLIDLENHYCIALYEDMFIDPVEASKCRREDNPDTWGACTNDLCDNCNGVFEGEAQHNFDDFCMMADRNINSQRYDDSQETNTFSFKQIHNYGCWCNFDDPQGTYQRLMMGESAPQDKVDTTCRDYQLCLRCAKWDGSQYDDYNCDPHTEEFMSAFSSNIINKKPDTAEGNGLSTQTCFNDFNESDCKISICRCHQQFVRRLIDEHLGEPIYNELKQVPNGPFEWDQQCKVDHAPIDMQCCGRNPNRYPFNADNPNKSCCGKYNSYPFNPNYQYCDTEDPQNPEVRDIGYEDNEQGMNDMDFDAFAGKK